MGNGQSEPVLAGTVRLEEQDLIRAYRTVGALRGVRMLSAIGAGTMIVLGSSWTIAAVGGGSVGGLCCLLPVAIGGLGLWRAWTQANRKWRALPEWQKHIRFELTSQGMRVQNERELLEQTWDRFGGWSEDASAFYVEREKRQFQIVPKRAFEGDAEAEAVRSILRERVRSRPELRKNAPLILVVILALAAFVGAVFLGIFIIYYQLVALPTMEQQRGAWPEDAPSLQEAR